MENIKRSKTRNSEGGKTIIGDRIQNQACGGCRTYYKETDQSVLDKHVVKIPHTSSLTRLMKSNKRLRKPD